MTDALRRGILRVPLTLAICLLVGGTAATLQEPIFKTAVRTVPVYVTVTDVFGRLVPNLTRDDFAIDDNGTPQNITVFANEVQPIMVVVLLDRSRSVAQSFGLVRKAAEQFVDRLLPADRARIGSFSYRIQVDPQEFTSDKDQLRGILRTQLQEAGPTPLWNAISVGMTALLHEEGRRVVLVFTDGADAPGNGRATNISLRDDIDRAREEDVMVYGVGLAGRNPGMGGRGGGFGGGRGGRGGFGGGSRGGGADKPDPGLAKMAAESGGGYFELASTTDLAEAFAKVADELHHQYALGFAPTKLDGKTHKLTIHVKREGLKARARQSYVATPGR
jgi:Ca-activated chloride channel homolog